MSYKLFLDDAREPLDCITYMHTRIGPKNPIYAEEWVIVKNYEQFVLAINTMGLPEYISFDHDLADTHYANPDYYRTMAKGDYDSPMFSATKERTGYHCAHWLVDYCIDKGVELPTCFVHSMNPIGTENIIKYLENAKKKLNNV